MTRPQQKASSKKHPKQKRGVDFKKIKRKIGRKLPPPKNTTNTEIKSKAIVLPEQSVAAEKAGLAVNKKGLTLKELLQQTSHHNAKVRRDALLGIKDLLLKHPAECKSNRYAVIDKLRERVGDDDRVVRELLYQLLKLVILPGCKEDNETLSFSLLTVYIFNAMTHLAVETRIMAFKFLDLVIEFYPPSLVINAEKVFHNYVDILQNNKLFIEDKGKLKNVLAGLFRCLSLLTWKRNEIDSITKNETRQRTLHCFESDIQTKSSVLSQIIKSLKELVPVLLSCFQEFIPLVQSISTLDGKSFDCVLSILQSVDLLVQILVNESCCRMSKSDSVQDQPIGTLLDEVLLSALLKKLFFLFPLSKKDNDRYLVLDVIVAKMFFNLEERVSAPLDLSEEFLNFIHQKAFKICRTTQSKHAILEKHLISLLSFIPKLVSQVHIHRQTQLLKTFTETFRESNPESSVRMACLSVIEEMLVPTLQGSPRFSNESEILYYQKQWMKELPSLLFALGDKHPVCSQVVLRLLLHLGKCALLEPLLADEYADFQVSLQKFYSECKAGGYVCFGPFVRLPKECQELSLSCLYYLSHVNSPLFESIALSCLCPDLDPSILFRIIEILHSAYKIGNVGITSYLSFVITLLSRFKVCPENIYATLESSNCQTFRSMTGVVFSFIAQMGDESLVFQIAEKVILDHISQKSPLDNTCALLRLLAMLDEKPTKLSEKGTIILSNRLLEYMITITVGIPKDDNGCIIAASMPTLRYYLLPCFILFHHNYKLLSLVLKTMALSLTEHSSSLVFEKHDYFGGNCLSRISAVVSCLLWIHTDAKLWRILSSFESDVRLILQSVLFLQASEEGNLKIEERHKIQRSIDQLKDLLRTIPQ